MLAIHVGPEGSGVGWGRGFRRRGILGAVAGMSMVLVLAGCGQESGAPNSVPEEATQGDAVALVVFPNPCDGMPMDCRELGGVDVDGDGQLDGVGVTVRGGQQRVVVATDSGEVSWQDLPVVKELGMTPDPGNLAFMELNGLPGAEIVVPTGDAYDANTFGVLTWSGGKLDYLGPPGPVFGGLQHGGWALVMTDKAVRSLECTDTPGTLRVHQFVVEGDDSGQPDGQTFRDFRYDDEVFSAGEASKYLPAGESQRGARPETSSLALQDRIDCDQIAPQERTGMTSATTPVRTTPAAEPCDESPDLDSPVVRDAIAQLPAPASLPDAEWASGYSGNFTSCGALTYAEVGLVGATNSSPYHTLLFSHGEFVGVARECPLLPSDYDATDDEVTVTYRYPKPGEPNAGMTGRAVVSYTWDGENVVADGTIPAEYLAMTGCAS